VSPSYSCEIIKPLLESTRLADLQRGLELVRVEIARLGSQDARPLFEMICSVFYIDPLDHPELMPVLDEAINLVVGFGTWVIPALVERLDAGDLKAQMAASQALGRIGADAIPLLMAEYERREDVDLRVFVLYALGKIRSPKVLQAVPLALEAARSDDLELRDTATRTLGKFVESIPPAALPLGFGKAILERVRRNLSDSNAGIRAKAIRTWGKMAKFGHLEETAREELKWVCQRLLGVDDEYEWDRAYIVRKQAEDALRNLAS
jgi:HEAT repeat protein